MPALIACVPHASEVRGAQSERRCLPVLRETGQRTRRRRRRAIVRAVIQREHVVEEIPGVDDAVRTIPRNDLRVGIAVGPRVRVIQVGEAAVLALHVVLARQVDDRVDRRERRVDRNLIGVVLVGVIERQRVVRTQLGDRAQEDVREAAVVVDRHLRRCVESAVRRLRVPVEEHVRRAQPGRLGERALHHVLRAEAAGQRRLRAVRDVDVALADDVDHRALRCPPNSAGNAPVKISIESILRGSNASAKFVLVVCGNGAPSIS